MSRIEADRLVICRHIQLAKWQYRFCRKQTVDLAYLIAKRCQTRIKISYRRRLYDIKKYFSSLINTHGHHLGWDTVMRPQVITWVFS